MHQNNATQLITFILKKKKKTSRLHLRYSLRYRYKSNSIYNTDRIETYYMLIEKSSKFHLEFRFIHFHIKIALEKGKESLPDVYSINIVFG